MGGIFTTQAGSKVEPVSRVERPLPTEIGNLIGFARAVTFTANRSSSAASSVQSDIVLVETLIRQQKYTEAVEHLNVIRAKIGALGESLRNIETAGGLIASHANRLSERTVTV